MIGATPPWGLFGEVLGEPVGIAGRVFQPGRRIEPNGFAGWWSQGPTATTGSGTSQRRRHFVEPVDGTFLGTDAAAQHQVLMQQCAAAEPPVAGNWRFSNPR